MVERHQIWVYSWTTTVCKLINWALSVLGFRMRYYFTDFLTPEIGEYTNYDQDDYRGIEGVVDARQKLVADAPC